MLLNKTKPKKRLVDFINYKIPTFLHNLNSGGPSSEVILKQIAPDIYIRELEILVIAPVSFNNLFVNVLVLSEHKLRTNVK